MLVRSCTCRQAYRNIFARTWHWIHTHSRLPAPAQSCHFLGYRRHDSIRQSSAIQVDSFALHTGCSQIDLCRALLGWLCPPKPAFLKFTTTKAIREMTFAKQVFQDIVMPLSTLKEQVNTATELFDTFPLLVYPCRVYDHQRGAQGQLRWAVRSLYTSVIKLHL